MAITISGENNNDRILAQDGVIDQISGINIVGLITASHINVGSNIQLGNAGIITATTFVGNVTGNVNSTSPLLLQTGGSERFRITSDNALGIAGANYGSSGQVLTSGGSGSAVTWSAIPTQVTIANNADNRVITGGSGTNLNGEANFTWDGNKIHATATGEIARFQSTNSVSTIRLYSTASSHTEIGHTEDTYIAVGGAERFRIKGSDGSIQYQSGGGKGYDFGSSGSSASVANMFAPASYTIAFGTNNVERLRIDLNGNVNIGVNGSSNPFTYLRFGASLYGAADIRPTDEASHKVGLAFYTDGTQDTTINPTEKLRITSSGKVIVGNDGTTFGNAAVQAFIQHGNTAGESGFSSVDTTSVAAGVGGEIAFHGKYNTGAQDYAYLGHIRGIKENATAGNTACALTFYTRPNATAPIERLRIDSSGHLTPRADTSYDLGANTSYRWRNIYGQTLSLTSYATVGSIVASDPGSSYYAYNNRIGNGLAVVGTTRLFGLVGVGDNAPSSSRSYGIDISNTDNTTGHGTLTDQRGRSDLIIRNKSGTLYSYSQLMFTNGNDGYNSATFLRHTKGGYLQNENYVGDLILMTRVAGNGSANNDFREKCTWPGGTTKAKQVWWSNGDGYSSNAQHMGEHKMIESEVVGNNEYTFFTLDTGSGSYSRGGIGRYTVTWTTGHASGTGYQTGDFRYWQHHQSGGTTVVQEHIIHRQGYSSGSYYSWNDSPKMKIFHNNATGNDGGIHFRCEGRRSSGYDMGLYVTIFLDLYAPKSSNGNVTPTLRARGHSQPANFSSEKDAFFVMYQRNNPNHSDNADRNTGLPTSNPGTAGVFYRDGTDVRVSTG